MTYEQQRYPDPNQGGYGQQPVNAEPPVGEPMFDAGFVTATARFFKGYVKFKGRASRAEFWWAYLALNLIMLIPTAIYIIGMSVSIFALFANTNPADMSGPDFGLRVFAATFGWMIPLLIVSYGTLLPTYSAMWRRLQDAGFHGALALLSIIGLSIVPLVMCIMPTSPKALQYGPGAVPAPPGGFYDPTQYGYQQPSQGYPGYGQPGYDQYRGQG